MAAENRTPMSADQEALELVAGGRRPASRLELVTDLCGRFGFSR